MLPTLYNAADIGVWPGDHSITVLEAAATGLPVIVPSADSAYSVLFDAGAAMGFERGAVLSLRDALLTLLENENQRSTLGDKAARLASDELSWRKIAQNSLVIYRSSSETS